MSIPQDILARAKQAKVRVTCAESCTGGMVASALTDLPGSSAMFDRGFITYSNAAKEAMLDVQPETLATFGAVSEAVAREMAMGALRASDAHLAVSVTGIAGPGGSEHKPEGRVCFGIATASGAHVETQEFGALGRTGVRIAARDHALQLLCDALSRMLKT